MRMKPTMRSSCRGLRLLCSLVLLAVLACENKPPAVSSFGTVEAPEMSLAFLDGSEKNLSDLEGRVVLLNFWATWCPPCLEELPEFESLHRAYRDQGLSVVGLSMDQAGRDYVRTFVEKQGITYPVAMGAFETVEQIWGPLADIPTVHGFGSEAPAPANGTVQMMPTTFVIDRSGRIYRKHVGPRDRETLEPELRKLMGLDGSASRPS